MATPSQKRHLTLLLLLTLFTILLLSFSPSHPPLSLPSNPPPFATLHHHNNHPPPPFSFTIKLLAYNRLSSLSRSLSSLSSALYSSDPIHLHIFIDHAPLGPHLQESRKILDFVDGFKWDFGVKLVHYRTLNVGLQAQWLEAWWPTSDDEFVFVVEDDLEVSPFYYLVIKDLILNYYYNESNFSPYVFGASLQRPRFVPGRHGNKINLDDGTRLFLYQVVGTWGQLLFPKPWKEFRLWYDDHKARGIKPILEGMVTTGWYKRMGEKIWTPWFFKFIHSRGYFNIYTNLLHERALSVSHRDAGVNYGKTAGPDSQLVKENSGDINLLEMPSLSNLQWYDFCFKRVCPGRVAKKLDEVDPILLSMAKEKPVLLVSLSKSSEAIVRNLICHFERLNIQNYIFMGQNSKLDLLHDLSRRGHPVIITEDVFDSIKGSKKSSSESIKEIVVISYAIKRCLESGFDSWVIPSNVLPLSSSPQLDIAPTVYTCYVGKNSRFFFVKSSSSSRQHWDERFLQKFTKTLDSLVIEDSSLEENGYFVDFVEKFVEHHDFKLKDVDDSSFSLKLERVNGNQSLPTTTRMISWSSETDFDLVHKLLEELGMWIIDDENSCKAVVCHQS